MSTYFLKFPDEATAQTALAAAGIYVDGAYRQAAIGWAFDPIGTIIEGGEWDSETGEELVPPTIHDGWHANYIGEPLPPELVPFNLDPGPTTPYRVFA